MEIVQTVWKCDLATNPMQNISLKLEALKPKLKVLTNEEFRATTQKITQARIELLAVQEQMKHNQSAYLQKQENTA